MPISAEVAIAVVLWFAIGWYMNVRLRMIDQKFDDLNERFSNLQAYLYEIDPQFNDERDLMVRFEKSLSGEAPSFAGASLHDLRREKQERGERTLTTGF